MFNNRIGSVNSFHCPQYSVHTNTYAQSWRYSKLFYRAVSGTSRTRKSSRAIANDGMSLEFDEFVPIKIKVEPTNDIDNRKEEAECQEQEAESIKKETVFIKVEPNFINKEGEPVGQILKHVKKETNWDNSAELLLKSDVKETESTKEETDSEEEQPNHGKESVWNNCLETTLPPVWPALPQTSASASDDDSRQEQLTPSVCPALWVECIVDRKQLSKRSKSSCKPTEHVDTTHEPKEKLTYGSALMTHEARSYFCRICHKNFTRSSHLKRHIISHSGEKLYSCETCKIKFTQHSDLQRHMKKKHGVKETTSEQIHENVSTKLEAGARPYSCEICEKKFIRSSHLKRHVKSHSGEKLYACDICRMKFTRPSDLRRHINNNHTAEKPSYTCNLCKKQFAQASNLKRHEQLHTGVKPYSCDVCEKKFTELGHLKTHKRIHTGEKPCICDICEMKFTKTSDLRRHQITHTKAKPYSCEICEKKFTRPSHLRIHKTNSHGEAPILGM